MTAAAGGGAGIAAGSGDLAALVYVSTARPPLSAEALAALLDGSRQRNAAAGITGLLLYCDGSVLQLLEGPAAAVDRLFARIRADARHGGVLEILRTPVSSRLMPRWGMAFDAPGSRAPLSPALHAHLLLHAEDGDRGSRTAARIVLQVAEGMRLGDPACLRPRPPVQV